MIVKKILFRNLFEMKMMISIGFIGIFFFDFAIRFDFLFSPFLGRFFVFFDFDISWSDFS